MPGKSDDRERSSTKLNPVTDFKACSAVGYHLIMTAGNGAPLHDLRWAARAGRFIANDVEPQLRALVLRLDCLIGGASGRRNARDPGNSFANVSGYA